MRVSAPGETRLAPHVFRAPGATAPRTTLPPDLLNQASSRLQKLALLYAFSFSMAGIFPNLVVPDGRAMYFRAFHWLPAVLSITVALLVALALRSERLRSRPVTALAFLFEVVSCYGIATAEFLHPESLRVGNWIGLSWVAVWILIFNVVVPTPPRYAVIAALASITSVPVVASVSLWTFPQPVMPTALMMFMAFVLPYLIVVLMAYVGVRIIYALGSEVNRARELGSYRLVERLGAGGMGEVWKADHRLLARPAAIKLIRTRSGDPGGMASDEMRRRFEHEAQVIAQLRSPHTVTLFDFGVAEDGAFYYVMELLDGVDADTLVKRFGPLPAERVVHLLGQICHSLSEAESCGLVHRDIKPANIFLSRYGEDHDFVKVLDFGLAKATSRDAAVTEPALTIANMIQGTPAFIAPEQALGSVDIDIRTDIYATGCVAYWLLTGALVFPTESPTALLVAHAHEQPEPPSTRTALPIPAALDALILSCLSKDRTRRPQSARHLLESLAHVPVPEPWTEDRAREWWRTHLPRRT